MHTHLYTPIALQTLKKRISTRNSMNPRMQKGLDLTDSVSDSLNMLYSINVCITWSKRFFELFKSRILLSKRYITISWIIVYFLQFKIQLFYLNRFSWIESNDDVEYSWIQRIRRKKNTHRQQLLSKLSWRIKKKYFLERETIYQKNLVLNFHSESVGSLVFATVT